VETYIQGSKNGRDDEMAVFFGEVDPRAIEDRKRLKLTRIRASNELELGAARAEV
jgi:hypothetical protein